MSMYDQMAFEEWQSLPLRDRQRLLRENKRHKRNRKFKLAYKALAGGPWAAAALLGATGASFNGKYTPLEKSDDKPPKLLPRKEVVSRKKKQIKYQDLSAGTALAGVTAAGAGKTIEQAKKIKGQSAGKKLNALSRVSPKIQGAGMAAFTVGAGVGALNALNTATLTRDELHRKFPETVKKRVYEPEKNRRRRQLAYTPGLIAGGALAAATADKTKGKVAEKANKVVGELNRTPKVNLKNVSSGGAKKAIIASGATLAGLGVANEVHRHTGGKTYKYK